MKYIKIPCYLGRQKASYRNTIVLALQHFKDSIIIELLLFSESPHYFTENLPGWLKQRLRFNART